MIELGKFITETSEAYRRAKEALESRGFVIFPIEPKSLDQILDEQSEYFDYVNPSKVLRDFKPPEAIEIAIHKERPALPDSNYRTQKEQIEMIRDWGRVTKQETGLTNLQIRMGHASECAQADIAYQKQCGRKLFPDFFARTLDKTTGSGVASVGRPFPESRLRVLVWYAVHGRSIVCAVPVVVLPPRR